MTIYIHIHHGQYSSGSAKNLPLIRIWFLVNYGYNGSTMTEYAD